MAKADILDRTYESMFICPSDTPQKQVDDLVEKLKAVVTNGKGKVDGVQVWGRRRLAYQIDRHRDGLYMYIDFTSGRKVPAELEVVYRVTDFVIRHVTLQKTEPTDLPPQKPAVPAVPSETKESQPPQKT